MRLRILSLVPLALLLVALVDLAGILSAARATPACTGGSTLVMGAAQYNGVPSPAFERRLERALEHYEQGCTDHIIVSGGSRTGDRFSEGRSGAVWLTQRGVPPEKISAEEEALNSWQNVRNSQGFIEGRLQIVTDDLHAFRGGWVARRHGLEAALVPVAGRGGRGGYVLRELAGMLAYQAGLVH